MKRGRPVLRNWLAIPDRIEAAVRARPGRALDLRGGPNDCSMRETAHHLVEANLVAVSMVIAALGTDGGRFDWTWLMPDTAWMRRLRYERVPVAPSVAALRAVGRHVAGVLEATGDGLRRKVELWDAPGAPHYTKTVEQILAMEVAHAREHLGEQTRPRRRAARRRTRRRAVPPRA